MHDSRVAAAVGANPTCASQWRADDQRPVVRKFQRRDHVIERLRFRGVLVGSADEMQPMFEHLGNMGCVAEREFNVEQPSCIRLDDRVFRRLRRQRPKAA